jgi:hypothetical protein
MAGSGSLEASDRAAGLFSCWVIGAMTTAPFVVPADAGGTIIRAIITRVERQREVVAADSVSDALR